MFSISRVTKKILTEKCTPTIIESLIECRLIPLGKNPGLRPIDVDEILRRITGKVLVSAMKEDITSSVGSLQVCAGHEADVR